MKKDLSITGSLHAEMDILIFCTSIEGQEEVDRIRGTIDNIPGILGWNVDLEDWEKVLRIESRDVNPFMIMEAVRKNGISISEMPG